MATQVKMRRGTAEDHKSFIGALGELTMDTTENDLRLHDGAKEGGHSVTLTSVARVLNRLDGEVIYSTDTTTVLNPATGTQVLYIYAADQQKTYAVPTPTTTGETISSVSGSVLTTSTAETYNLESINRSDLKMTLAEAIADTSLLVGDSVRITDRADGIFDVVLASTVTTNSYDIVAHSTLTIALVLRVTGRLDIQHVGAKGTGDDDTNAIRRAILLSLDIYISEPELYYLVTDTIELRGGQSITGYSKSGGVSKDTDADKKSIYASMAVNGTPIFSLGDGSDTDLRKMTFTNLRAYCLNGSVLQMRLTTELQVTGCEFRSRFYHCIDSEMSFVNSFTGCSLNSSGTVDDLGVDATYMYRGMDNSNGITFNSCRVTGGSLGGVADIGRSYDINFVSCIVESSKYGIHIGKNSSTVFSGSCNKVKIDCQFESVQNPIDIGSIFIVSGVDMSNLLITNPATDTILGASVILGRVRGLEMMGAQFDIADNAYPFLFKYDSAAAGQGSLAYLEDSVIKNTYYKDVTDGFGFDYSGFSASQLNFLAENELDLLETDTGTLREYVTGVITASAGTVPSYIKLHDIKPLGSQLEKVEVIEADGTIDGRIVIGWSGAQDEYFDESDLSVLTLDDGYADISSSIGSKFMRATESVRVRHISGVGTGTFRIRITYKS